MVPSTQKPPGKVALQHLIVEVFGQPINGTLSNAFWGRAGISDIHDVLALSKVDREALSYIGDAGTLNYLPIGHQNMLKVAKIFASFCIANGSPIADWTKVTKQGRF